jgi:hypothetical protein
MLRGRFGHEALAGAVGASAVLGGAVAGPLWATALDVASACVTAAIAAHAVEEVARERGLPGRLVLARAARDLGREPNAPLAAHAIEAVCRARHADSRALRSLAILIGKATTRHARGVALQLLGSWLAPMRSLTSLAAPFAAARAAVDSAELVRALTEAVPAPHAEAAVPQAVPQDGEAAPPESGRFALGTFGATLGQGGLSIEEWNGQIPNLEEAA